MYYVPQGYPYPYFVNVPVYNYGMPPMYMAGPGEFAPERMGWVQPPMKRQQPMQLQLHDYGPDPFVVNIEEAVEQNNTFRTVLWTGKHLQVAVMSIPPREEIGLEMHPQVDQFLRIEEGQGLVRMGPSQDQLNIERYVNEESAIMVPAGTWHNIINMGNETLKLYTIYGPPQHPYGTIDMTKADA